MIITPVKDRVCSTCEHEGCCTYPCAGHNWSPAYVECERCGRTVASETAVAFDGATLCEECADCE